jgi:dTDP-4-amino-4,6-dideoxygalactose transaminase
VQLLRYDEADAPNYQYVVIEVDAERRDEIVAALHAENILARKYFWPGCHGMKPYRELFPHARLMLPNTEAVAARVIVLPTGETLPDGCIDTVASVCRQILGT